MSSSYSSLLSLSPEDQIGAWCVDDDMASYLPFAVVGEDYYQPEPAAITFLAEEQAPAPLIAEADSYNIIGGESSRQSQLETAMLGGGSEGFSNESMGSRRSSKIAFKTRSEVVEVLDDGYRWRKYGKKMVKNSPNPRNYFRCSREGCRVKKQVERQRDDARFVITTYDGVHNHPAARPGGFAGAPVRGRTSLLP